MTRIILILTVAALLIIPTSAGEQSSRDHRLKGRIVRALAVEPGNPSHVLVGQKADKAGSGLVFKSLDGTRNWRTQNGNAPLSANATDVQAVAAVSPDLLLAGTWKHGLYASRNGGRKFDRLAGFPGSDIRDLQVVGGKIFAATPRHGILVSTDHAKSWTSIGPNQEFFWSVNIIDDAVYASSLDSGVYRRQNGSWEKIFDKDKASAFAATAHRRAVAGDNGLYIAEHGPWRQTLRGEKFADVVMPDNDTILAGTWGDGLHIIPLSQIVGKRTALIDAVVRNDTAAAAQLLNDGADPDGYDGNRNTPLIFAARDGQLKVAKLLIDAGASPGWVDGEQATPLILAAFRDHIDMVRLLLSLKVDRQQRDKWGRSAQDYAIRRGKADPIYRLLQEQ